MKKLFLVSIAFLMISCLSACNESGDAEYTYLPKTELHTYNASSGFYREYKTTYKYDDNYNIIKKTEYTKKGIFNTRERRNDTKYTYYENGDISQEFIRIEDFCTSITDGHHIYEQGYNYIYNENQQLIKKEDINPPSFDDDSCGYEYEYDENSNLVKEYKYFSDGSKELEFEYIYDSKNILIEKLHIANSFDSPYIWDRTEYTYDNDGKLTYLKTVHYELSGEESHYDEVDFYYDKLNRLVKEEKTSFDNNGKIESKEVKEYKDFIKYNIKDN